jgi:hypothetical protein
VRYGLIVQRLGQIFDGRSIETLFDSALLLFSPRGFAIMASMSAGGPRMILPKGAP